MSQSEKKAYFDALKAAGVQFDKHYRNYTTAELQQAYDRLIVKPPVPVVMPEPQPTWQGEPHPAPPAYPGQPQPADSGPIDPEAAAFYGFAAPAPEPAAPVTVDTPLPVRPADPNEMAGQRLNSKADDEPIRTDEHGRVWFQEEVKKPAYPKPRGRRVLTYMDAGSREETFTNGKYRETFEVPGDPANARPAEVKITLPSYQVGIYKDPRLPFKVITYNANEGFDMVDVQEYYGGSELVPEEVKRKYVENVLCYDIRTTVRAIEAEYRQQQLVGHHRI